MQKQEEVDPKLLQTPNHQINIPFLKKCLHDHKKIPAKYVESLIFRFHKILSEQPNVVYKTQPITVIGDIHGQYYALEKIISLFPNKLQNKHTALFLGDYVDRGPYGMQIMILLMAMKINSKNSVVLLRGNHQTRYITGVYGFLEECRAKYNQQIYDLLMKAFDALPLACVVDNKYFCSHGGISPYALSVQEINKIDRHNQIQIGSAICDLVWSDPTQSEKGLTHKLYDSNQAERGCSIIYGRQLTNQFLKKNNFFTIIRAHQVHDEGFKKHNWQNQAQIPSVFTIFSAPKYPGRNNKGCIMMIQSSLFKLRQFNEQKQDFMYLIPQHKNAFNYLQKQVKYLQNLVHGICQRTARKKIKAIPEIKEIKDLTNNNMLALLVKYALDRKVKPLSFEIKSSSDPLHLQNALQNLSEQDKYTQTLKRSLLILKSSQGLDYVDIRSTQIKGWN